MASLPRPAQDRQAAQLGVVELVALGIGAVVGAGVFVITGTAAARYAGPAISLSFAAAAGLCGLVGWCFSKCVEAAPAAAGAPAHIRAGFGETAGWLAGWALVAEFGFAIATVAVGWSGYVSSLLAAAGAPVPAPLLSGPPNGLVDLPAALIVLALAALTLWGLRQSVRLLSALVVVKLAVIVVVLVAASRFVTLARLTPFVPANEGGFGAFGWSGVLRGTIVAFSAYLGFDVIAAAAPQARRPRRDTALAMAAVLLLAALLYAATAIVMTGVAPFRTLDAADPLLQVLPAAGGGLDWLRPWIGGGAVVGLTSVLLSLLVALPRMTASLAREGGLPAALGGERTALAAVAAATALLAGLAPMRRLAELIAVAALVLFSGVAARAYQLTRGAPALLCLAATLGLLAAAPWTTLGWFALWMAGGGLIGWMMRRRPR
jgi:basic amino acid/polyamine antiporter, APA family